MFCLNKTAAMTLLCSLFAAPAMATDVLKVGVSDSDAPPIVVLKPGNMELAPSLTKELVDALAAEMGMKPQYIILARKRVESAIESGKVDIVCNANPEWYGNASQLGWTLEFYAQTERVISLKNLPDIRQADDISGKRVGTIRGYNYPILEHLWASGRAQRIDESRLEFLIKSLQKKLSDVVITSEMELAAWAKNNPQEARSIKKHPLTISYTPTMCAVAPNASVTPAKLNSAISALRREGKINAILKNYT